MTSLYMQQLTDFIHSPSLLSLLWRNTIKVALWDHLAVCVSACVSPPREQFLNQSLWNLACIIMAPGPTSMVYSQIHPISNTNAAAPQNVELITLILLKCLNLSSWNLVCTSCYLSPSQWCNSQIPSISNTNTAASLIKPLLSYRNPHLPKVHPVLTDKALAINLLL
jgi:hypothetical protein